MDVDVVILSPPEGYSNDLCAEVRWASDSYALVFLNVETRKFTVAFFMLGRGKIPEVDLEDIERGFQQAKESLLRIEGLPQDSKPAGE